MATALLDAKLELLYLAREIDDADDGVITDAVQERIERISARSDEGGVHPVQLRVFCTRVRLSLLAHGRDLPPLLQSWNPWGFTLYQNWRVDGSEAAQLLRSHLRRQCVPDWLGILDVRGTLDLSRRSIASLPASVGELVITGGHLQLSHNLLASLPESVHTITVDGDICLDGNLLQEVPDTIGGLTVGRDLCLDRNRLEALPEHFGNMIVGGDLRLSHNRLISLPRSFGRLDVPGSLTLNRNLLQALPSEIGNIRVGGDLRLERNALVEVPAECRDMRVAGEVWLGGNPLEAPPSRDAIARVVLESGRRDLCKRRAKRFVTDVVLGANCASLALLQLASDTTALPPWSGWRFAPFVSQPSPTAYMGVAIVVLGVCNALVRALERHRSARPPPRWRRHLLHPFLCMHVLVGYDALVVLDAPPSVADALVYYCFTVFSFAMHSLLSTLAYGCVPYV